MSIMLDWYVQDISNFKSDEKEDIKNRILEKANSENEAIKLAREEYAKIFNFLKEG